MLLIAPRRPTRVLHVGDVKVGGENPIVVQSMATADTRDPIATLRQIHELAEAGCEIVRIAVPDRRAAAALPDIVPHAPVPLIADIHFEHTLALKALDAGIHGLRLNPGNIRKPEDVREVVVRAKERQVPIRIGVNFGSVAPMPEAFVDEMAERGATQIELRAEWLVRSALGHIQILEDLDFGLTKVSLKAFELPVLFEAYRRFAALPNDYPLHLGVTEAERRDRKRALGNRDRDTAGARDRRHDSGVVDDRSGRGSFRCLRDPEEPRAAPEGRGDDRLPDVWTRRSRSLHPS